MRPAPTIYEDLEQGTEEWFAARRGIVTASVVGKLITVGPRDALMVACPTCYAESASPCVSVARKQPTAIKSVHEPRTAHAASLPPVYSVADNETSRNLTLTLAAERITGWTEETPMTSDMWRGVEGEPFAREAYAEHYAPVTEVGFMRLDAGNWSLGYSPDGLVGEDGLIEIKAPRAKGHMQTVLTGEVPANYMPQVQAGLLVSGRRWCDFLSYVGGMHLYPIRVYPDERWFDAITDACLTFEHNVARIVADYEERVTDMPMTERISFDLEVA